MGLGFTGGLLRQKSDEDRGNFRVLGLNSTRIERTSLFFGLEITPAAYHNWKDYENSDQTSFGLDVHVNFLKNRLRVNLGARDVINNLGNTAFLTIAIADLPGLVYWLSR